MNLVFEGMATGAIYGAILVTLIYGPLLAARAVWGRLLKRAMEEAKNAERNER